MTPGAARAIAFGLVVGGGAFLCIRLIEMYRRDVHDSAGLPSHPHRDVPRRFSYLTLALVSAAGLFLELLLIRWVSSEIRVFAYFKNFVLIAAFLGFGIGFQFSKRRIRPAALATPLVFLVFVVALQWGPLRTLMDALPEYIGPFSTIHIWRAQSGLAGLPAISALTAAILISGVLFAVVAVTFIPVGQLIGWNIEHARNGIWAYSVNLLGSLAGILLFAMLASLRQPPLVWFVIAWFLLMAAFWPFSRARPILVLAGALSIAVVAIAGSNGAAQTHWSPYQKLSVSPNVQNGQIESYLLTTNDTWYQQVIDLSDEFLASRPEILGDVPNQFNSYNLPYRFVDRAPSVLILGAGMGNDAAGALRNGASRVVAVEIDPVIIDLGQELHFEAPYADPRVEIVIDDARAYVERSEEKFDLIVFALLDSHTTASSYSNVRIDNYVYTLEAMQRSAELLTPNGVMVVKFQVDTPWIGGRINGLLTEVFGTPPLSLSIERSYSTSASFFIAGDEEALTIALADQDLSEFVDRSPKPELASAVLTSDDWPFFYQESPGVPLVVSLLSVTLIGLAVMTLRRVGVTAGSLDGHFFFLGAGFLLLEVHIVSRMALLFGTTWVVNAVVISGVLLLAVAANVLVARKPQIRTAFAWFGLFASIGIAYAIPVDALLLDSVALRIAVASLALCAPAFFAGIIFISSFARSGFRGTALGWNLLGALVGGLIEGLSLWTGMRSMAVVAALLYLGALFTRPKASRSVRRDREQLSPSPTPGT